MAIFLTVLIAIITWVITFYHYSRSLRNSFVYKLREDLLSQLNTLIDRLLDKKNIINFPPEIREALFVNLIALAEERGSIYFKECSFYSPLPEEFNEFFANIRSIDFFCYGDNSGPDVEMDNALVDIIVSYTSFCNEIESAYLKFNLNGRFGTCFWIDWCVLSGIFFAFIVVALILNFL